MSYKIRRPHWASLLSAKNRSLRLQTAQQLDEKTNRQLFLEVWRGALSEIITRIWKCTGAPIKVTSDCTCTHSETLQHFRQITSTSSRCARMKHQILYHVLMLKGSHFLKVIRVEWLYLISEQGSPFLNSSQDRTRQQVTAGAESNITDKQENCHTPAWATDWPELVLIVLND